MHELGMSPAVAAVLDGGPSGSVEAPLLGAREGFGLGRPIAEGSPADADRSDVEARQGHGYDHYGLRVIALETGTYVLVLPHRDGRAGLSYHVKASELVPLPMTYYHGEVPR